MCDMLIVMFTNMVTNDQVIVNPPVSFRYFVWKYYGFLGVKLSAKFAQQLSSIVPL